MSGRVGPERRGPERSGPDYPPEWDDEQVPSSPVALLDQLDELRAAAHLGSLRVGEHYEIHLYAGQDPVGMTLRARDSALIVAAVNAVGPLTAAVRAVLELADELDRYTTMRGRPAPGSHDDGVNKAQADAARLIHAAITAALSVTP